MTNQEMIIELQYTIDLIKQNGQDWLDERDIPILEAAISALQEQDLKTRKICCDTCKHDPLKMDKWPCVDCDMREPADRLESQDVSDTKVGDMVSRAAAIDATWKEPSYTDLLNVLTEVRDRIKALPSAEPEIVRCKDCKYADYDCVCQNNKGLAIQDDDDFCSHAKRRTNERSD